MAGSLADVERLGRKIARAQGFDADDPNVNWVAYGKEVEWQLGRPQHQQNIPSPERFRLSPPEPPAVQERVAVEGMKYPGSPHPHRVVRIGQFEVSMAEQDAARNRTQWERAHRGQRTTGRYRSRFHLLRDRSRSDRLQGRR
jgi:hypothetical protein